MHGAGAPQVREAAARRLAEAEAAAQARVTFVRHHVEDAADPFAALQDLTREMLAIKNALLGRIVADESQLATLLPAWHALAARLADTLVDTLRLDPTSLPGRQAKFGTLEELLSSVPDAPALPPPPPPRPAVAPVLTVEPPKPADEAPNSTGPQAHVYASLTTGDGEVLEEV